jgi:hypothetical protein
MKEGRRRLPGSKRKGEHNKETSPGVCQGRAGIQIYRITKSGKGEIGEIRIQYSSRQRTNKKAQTAQSRRKQRKNMTPWRGVEPRSRATSKVDRRVY